MGVQKEILVRTLDGSTQPGGGERVLQGGAGALAIGKPGDVLAKAFGPLVFTEIPATGTYTFGTYVEGKGILANSNDNAFYSASAAEPFGYTVNLKAGMQAAFMQYGIVVVLCRDLANVLAGMNAKIVPGSGYESGKVYAADSKDVCAVEVMGFKSYDSLATLTITAPANGRIEGAVSGSKFVKGDKVKLTAVADEGYVLSAWGGAASGSDATVEVTMDGDKTVSATFAVAG